MIWPLIVMIAFNILNAFIDAYRILKNKKIAHGINFGAYILVFMLVVWVFQIRPIKIGELVFCWLFGRQIFFDPVLNLRRGLKIDYVSLDKPPKAWLDRQEVRLWGYNGRIALAVYGIGFIISTLIYVIMK